MHKHVPIVMLLTRELGYLCLIIKNGVILVIHLRAVREVAQLELLEMHHQLSLPLSFPFPTLPSVELSSGGDFSSSSVHHQPEWHCKYIFLLLLLYITTTVLTKHYSSFHIFIPIQNSHCMIVWVLILLHAYHLAATILNHPVLISAFTAPN